MTPEIGDLHDDVPAREELLRVNNANARETSVLTREGFDRMIAAAHVATFIAPGAAFLLAFEERDAYEGGHFLWFRSRFDRFLYIDRVVVAEAHRRHGLGRRLYADLFERAAQRGHARVVCEVNQSPPNPRSDAFHAAHGFEEVGRATLDGGAKTVRYLLKRCG
jgi:predicted GNAT superfamily acetyltransferase